MLFSTNSYLAHPSGYQFWNPLPRNVKIFQMQEDIDPKLYSRALKLLSSRPYSERELRDKLARRGDAAEIEKIVLKLKSSGLLNDLDLSYNFASYRARSKNVGRARAALELRRRGVSREVAERALEQVYREVSEAELIDRAIEKWLRRSDLKELARLRAYLERLGLSGSLIGRKTLRFRLELEGRRDDESL